MFQGLRYFERPFDSAALDVNRLAVTARRGVGHEKRQHVRDLFGSLRYACRRTGGSHVS